MKTEIEQKIKIDEEIKYLAEGIARYYYRKYDEIVPEIIAQHNNLKFHYFNYEDAFDGMLEYRNYKFHIYINNRGKDLITPKSKFTFGHELGHYFIDSHAFALKSGKVDPHSSITGYNSDILVERQADLFSANLLMPEFLVKKLYSKYRKFDPKIINDIMLTFGISSLAAMYRVAQLSLHPLMIVKSVNGVIEGNPYRVSDFYFKLNDKKNLPDDSLAKSYYINHYKQKTPKELWIIDWFDTQSNNKMFESCIYSDYQNTVFSILWVK